MRQIAAVVAASLLVTGCATNSYKIPRRELARLATVAPELRGERVRVQQELGEAEVGPPQPITAETQIVFFPRLDIVGPRRARYHRPRPTFHDGEGWSGGVHTSATPRGKTSGSSGSAKLGGDKGAAVAILLIAAVALFAVVAVEGSRFDGFARLHPMHPVHLVGYDGERAVMPLAWIDQATAEWAADAYVRRNEGPWQELERAPLDREGWNFSMYGGAGIYAGIDGSRGAGFASTIQLGYFPMHELGIVGSVFLGWRENEVGTTNFHARYTLEGQVFPVSSGFLQLGGYLGLGAAYRSDQRFVTGDVVASESETTRALTGGAIMQLDINTRIALTGRFGLTNAFGENTTEALFGLSVY